MRRRSSAFRSGDVPIYEPGLDKLIDDNASRLSFTTSYDELLAACRILFIAVDTPPSPSGDADLSRVQHATREIAARGGERLLVMKSTVPVGTGEKVVADLEALGRRRHDLRRPTRSSSARAPPSRTSSSPTASSSALPARRTATPSRRCTAASTPTSCAPACRPPRWSSTPPTPFWPRRSPSSTRSPTCASRSAPTCAPWPTAWGSTTASGRTSCRPASATAARASPRTCRRSSSSPATAATISSCSTP